MVSFAHDGKTLTMNFSTSVVITDEERIALIMRARFLQKSIAEYLEKVVLDVLESVLSAEGFAREQIEEMGLN